MFKDKNNPIKQEKIRKREELLKKGIDPYPPSWNKSRTSSSQLNKDFSPLATGESDKKLFHIAGRLMRKRPMGKAAFFNIQDEAGEFQCYIKRDDFASSPEDSSASSLSPWDLWKLCDIGDILGVSGFIFKTKKGELSLRVQDLKMLCKTVEPLPEKYHGLEDKELKYRFRHLDLIMDQKSRQVFQTRSKIIYEIRSFMNKKNFMEVETPVLQSIYGGAVAEPFETYFRKLDQKMYLKISPEIYLKKLIVGGFEKIFEIGKNFRNEGIDRSHNPEFTMMEYYEAYTDYEEQMNQFESLICHVVQKIKGDLKFKYQDRELDFTPPWARVSLKGFEAMICVMSLVKNKKLKEWTSFLSKEEEKPYREFIESNKDWAHIEQGSGFKLDWTKLWTGIQIQELLTYIKFLNSSGDLNKIEKNLTKNSKLSHLLDTRDNLAWRAFELSQKAGESKEPMEDIKKLLKNLQLLYPSPEWQEFKNTLEKEKPPLLKIRDQLAGRLFEIKIDQVKFIWLLDYVQSLDSSADIEKFKGLSDSSLALASWSKLFEGVFQMTDSIPSDFVSVNLKEELNLLALELTIEKHFWNPIFIMDFPLIFSPLTKKHRKDSRLTERFEPYIAGMEIGNAYTELNDPLEQRQRLKEQKRWSGDLKKSKKTGFLKKSKENPAEEHPVDENFLHALEVGMPPTGGVGLGIERLVMILCDQHSIKDSMLFPTLRNKT